MKKLFLTLSFLLFLLSSVVAETKEKAEHEMLPLEFNGTSKTLAEGLLRCSSLYKAYEVFELSICGYSDSKLDRDEFIESEDFKSCEVYEEVYEDIKLRNYRASVFRIFLGYFFTQ